MTQRDRLLCDHCGRQVIVTMAGSSIVSLWRLFVSNISQVWKEYQTRECLTAELLIECFPKLKERLRAQR